jgi:hypothetical protein
MTPREQALILRLCAADIADEPRSVIVLRRTLAALGWTDEAMAAALRQARAVLAVVNVGQERF